MMYDVVVIGAGLAGLIGGLRLAEAGYNVLLVAKGHGTTHWAAGTIDLLDGEQPRQTIGQLISEHPDHPYSRSGLEALDAALQRLRQICKDGGYPLVGSAERNTLLPTAAGALRPTALLPATMAAGDVRLPGQMLLVGFRQLRDFYPPLAAANLRAQGIDARAAYLDLPPARRRLDFPTTVVARLFEDAGSRATLAQQLRSLRGAATRIGLPAVLGMDRATQVVAALQEDSGALVFEIPTLPPSVPGIRLFNLLAQAFRRAGGHTQIGGWVVDKEAEGRRLKAIFTEAAARRQRHTARGFLLATGGIIGGGIRAEHGQRVVETALGLPVTVPNSSKGWFAERFMDQEGHAIYRAGIAVDDQLRPLDEHGDLAFENVAVAGAALGGADLIRERCYEGVALASGWRAAGMLMEQLEHTDRQRDRAPSLSMEA